ncbi:KH domain-containing protein [Spirosoma soli]
MSRYARHQPLGRWVPQQAVSCDSVNAPHGQVWASISVFRSTSRTPELGWGRHFGVSGDNANAPVKSVSKQNRKSMKECKVEALIYYSKLTLDSEHIVKKSKEEIQQKLDEYTAQGYRLASTTSTNFGAAIYIYLFFEKES